MSKQISEAVRLGIQAKSAQREYNRRLGCVEVIAKQTGRSILEACDILEQRTLKLYGKASQDLLDDLKQIRKDFAEDASA